jgi:hypothetical protein
MPTDLPARRRVQKPNDDRAKSGQYLVVFYSVAGLALLLLMSAETRLGMFDGLTVPESGLGATGTPPFPVDGIEPSWATNPPP